MLRNKSQETIQKIKYHAKNLGIFANLETIGSYHDFSQLVVLDYLDEKTFSQLLTNFQSHAIQDSYESLTRFCSTSVHELTHWLDHTSTLWGQRQLVLIYNAINAWTNQKEEEFYRIAIANSERQRARLAIYYTEKYKVNQQEAATIPWQYQYGSGLEFGIDGRVRTDRPFVFTIFSTPNNQHIIRVPFSMFALTESNATYAEFNIKIQALALLDNDSRLVEKSRLEQEIVQKLYNPELAIYSVATHCLANSIGIDEIFQSYKFSSALATLCLNLPKDLFYSLTVPEEFNILEDRVQALQELADPGFAFFTIAKQASKFQNGVSVGQWVQEALKNSGLPNLETINSLVIAQMKQLENQIVEGIYAEQLRSLLSIGRENFVKRGTWGQNVLSMENLHQTSMGSNAILLDDSKKVRSLIIKSQ